MLVSWNTGTPKSCTLGFSLTIHFGGTPMAMESSMTTTHRPVKIVQWIRRPPAAPIQPPTTRMWWTCRWRSSLGGFHQRRYPAGWFQGNSPKDGNWGSPSYGNFPYLNDFGWLKWVAWQLLDGGRFRMRIIEHKFEHWVVVVVFFCREGWP